MQPSLFSKFKIRALVVLIAALSSLSASAASYCDKDGFLVDLNTGSILRIDIRNSCQAILNASKEGVYCDKNGFLIELNTGSILRTDIRNSCQAILSKAK